MPRCLLKILTLGCLLFCMPNMAGCQLQKDPDRNSEENGTRLGAEKVPINKTIIDNIDKNNGDMTDWKFFHVASPTVVEVIIAFDNPNAKAMLVVREATGIQKTLVEHRREPLLKTTFKAEPGIYYLQIYARQEATDYTLEVLTSTP